MSIRLTQGTKELVPVTVYDRSGAITDLTTDATAIEYDVEYDVDGTFLYEGATGIASGMVIYCMLDLSATGPDGLIAADTRLRLFVEFTVGTERPRLGPVVIQVRDEP